MFLFFTLLLLSGKVLLFLRRTLTARSTLSPTSASTRTLSRPVAPVTTGLASHFLLLWLWTLVSTASGLHFRMDTTMNFWMQILNKNSQLLTADNMLYFAQSFEWYCFFQALSVWAAGAKCVFVFASFFLLASVPICAIQLCQRTFFCWTSLQIKSLSFLLWTNINFMDHIIAESTKTLSSVFASFVLSYNLADTALLVPIVSLRKPNKIIALVGSSFFLSLWKKLRCTESLDINKKTTKKARAYSRKKSQKSK